MTETVADLIDPPVSPEAGPAPSSRAPVAHPRHFPCFDGLRAIAAVSVLLLHTAWTSGFTLQSSLGVYTSRLEIGVSVFFLISGFLLYRPFVASHLTGRPLPDVGRFWVRRLLRIVPAYWLALTVLTYGFHQVAMGPGWQGIASHYLFLQIYLPTQAFYGIPQAWSLCTEMSFYFFLPLYAVIVAGRRRPSSHRMRRELIGLGTLVLISYGFRWWVLNLPTLVLRNGHLVGTCAPHCLTVPAFNSLLVDWLPSYLDLFALGMLLALVSSWMTARGSEPAWLRSQWMPWASWGAAAVTFWGVSHLGIPKDILYVVSPTVNIERQALYGLFAFFLLLPAVFGPQDDTLVRRLLRSWPMASLGVISYGIYLWHLNLIDEVNRWTGYEHRLMPFWSLAGLVLLASIAFASASYFGMERPLLTIKDRIGWWSRPARVHARRPVTERAAMSDTGASPEAEASRRRS